MTTSRERTSRDPRLRDAKPERADRGSTADGNPIPSVDLSATHGPIRAELDAAIARVLDSDQFILGPESLAFESEFAAVCGSAAAVGCGSGTDALWLALAALGIGPGDEVLCPAYSFVATATAIVRTGARPVFSDIDRATMNLDVADAERKMDAHPRLAAILPVDLYGRLCDLDAILALASSRGLPIIEDAAQAIGAED